MQKSRQWFASMAVFVARTFCPGRSNWLASGGNLVGAGCGYALNVQAFRFLLKKSGDAVNDLIQRSAGTEAGEVVDFFDGRNAAHHVLEAGFVNLVVRDVLNGRRTAGTLLHSMCQCLDSDF